MPETKSGTLEKSAEPSALQEERVAIVEAVCGKYAWVPTSSEEFARRKQIERELER